MLSGQVEQVLSSTFESTYFWPSSHVGCVPGQVVVWCAVAVWNVLSGQVEQVRLAVLVSVLICSPSPHVG